MDVLGDAIDRETRSNATALRAPAVGRTYDYRRFCTSAWKVGNFLRHLGVRGGAGVAIADDPVPEPVLTFYGAALLGGIVRFGPPDDVDGVRALVIPESDFGGYATGPSVKRVAYGGAPDDPSASYFERDVWSENPTEPPDVIATDDPLLRTRDGTYSHGAVVGAAETVVEEHGIAPGDEVVVNGSFTEAGVVAAGLVAPIVAGATVVLDAGSVGDIVVGGPESDVKTSELLDGTETR
ncbi:MAG: hypothetical protein ACI8UR_001054 [Natronomonas sp.]|jgi:hypothetical protein|uniref:acetyl-CoA synthetase n=1 Tax=Natronomonas sp. TaxID=2184060 RepID=UPI0039897165